MSTTYLVGEQTKRRIFEISRQLFYKQGYDETTYDDISKLAEINRALIPYYFKNKKTLALFIHEQLIEDYFSTCDKALDGTGISAEGRTAFYMFGYYRLLKNRNLSKFLVQFHSEIDDNDHMVIGKKRLFDILSIKNNEVSQSDYEILSQIDYGMEKEIIRISYYNKESDIDQHSSVEFRLILSFLGYSKEQIEAIIAEARLYLSKQQIDITDCFEFELK